MGNLTIISNNVYMPLILVFSELYPSHTHGKFVLKIAYDRGRHSSDQHDRIFWKFFSKHYKHGATWTCNQKFGILKFELTSVIRYKHYFAYSIDQGGFLVIFGIIGKQRSFDVKISEIVQIQVISHLCKFQLDWWNFNPIVVFYQIGLFTVCNMWDNGIFDLLSFSRIFTWL